MQTLVMCDGYYCKICEYEMLSEHINILSHVENPYNIRNVSSKD